MYYIIDEFTGIPTAVTNKDGEVIYSNNRSEANKYGYDHLQKEAWQVIRKWVRD